jgi:hypothetical protein
MLLPMKEFDLVQELAMYAATVAGLLVILVVAGGLLLLVRYLFRRGRLWRVKKL